MTNYESDTATMALVEDNAKYYADDLPSSATLQQELHVWQSKWKCVEKSNLPSTPSGSLAVTNKAMFPNIHTLLCIICTLPVITCECECRFSVLHRLKMHIHYGMELNLDEIINIFAGQNPRRMLLLAMEWN